MRLVLGIATVLGVVGPIAAFGLFYIGDKVGHLAHPELQTLMYLMLSVAGHLTIFLARTRGPFWSVRPARVLLLAVLGTQTLATLIAVLGLLMTPLNWRWALLVWGYALAWFLVTDRVKLLAYRILDPVENTGVASAATRTNEHQSHADLPRKAVTSANVTPFHTDTDPENPVYHDNSDCPYGQEIKHNRHDQPGADGRRRCDWCTQHAA
jgi:H+-transporting ATPase